MSPYVWLERASGVAECTLLSAEPAYFLNRCAAAGIQLRFAEAQSATQLRVVVSLRDLERAEQLARRSQCELRVLRRSGGSALRKRLLRRAFPALLLGMACLLLAWSKLYIWEIEISGNVRVPTGRIRSALSDCGVGIGSFWPDLTSDQLRCELLLRLPELAWATVNIYGSRAEVIVRERVEKPALLDIDEPVDLVADRIGFVTKVQALNGTAVVRPGSAVAPGELLIAGAADSPFSGTRLTHALGSVTAETYYELSAAAPATERVRSISGQHRDRWALLIGKKRVNFYQNASFCPQDCDKISTVWAFGIQGLFSLPVALLRQRVFETELAERERDGLLLRRELETQLHARLLAAVGDGGVIEEEHYSAAEADGRIVVCLRARCSENIAKEQKK